MLILLSIARTSEISQGKRSVCVVAQRHCTVKSALLMQVTQTGSVTECNLMLTSLVQTEQRVRVRVLGCVVQRSFEAYAQQSVSHQGTGYIPALIGLQPDLT